MSIYTKKGDKGETSLVGGEKIFKDDKRVCAYGDVDELNSVLGMVYASLQDDGLKETVQGIQKKLFIVGAQLASDREAHEKLKAKITPDDILLLESIIDKYELDFGKMKGFETPGETFASATLHFARTVVRRAEREAVSLSRNNFVDPLVLKYLNRLSDTLFVLAKSEVFDSFVKKVAERVRFEMKELKDKVFDILSKACFDASNKAGVPVCFAITDPNGDLLYFKRFDGCILVSIGISQNKAYTSAVFRKPTHELTADIAPNGPLYGINMTDPKIVSFDGGFPLFKDGVLVGAIGISGGTIAQDRAIGLEIVDCFNSLN